MISKRGSPLEPDRWERAEALFHEASDLPEDEVGSHLDAACAGDEALRRLVARLLSADGAGSVLDRSVEELATPLLEGAEGTGARAVQLDPGAAIGPYRLLDVLGSGGMGTVYRAERADGAYDRVVALKVVRAGRLAAEAEARFRREREILARLGHAGIATLLDGGVSEAGIPYLTMELVEGTAITDFADAHDLDVAARLRLVIQVAEAVDYAHRNLVVHRDLKPSNILVTESGAVKLLDFGIARLLAEEGSGDALTRTGLLLLTPDYAAPEQIRGEAVTTAVDVYAIGAVLYELIAGRRPFGDVRATWDELQRVIEEPPRAPSVARDLGPARLGAIPGDLDTIVLKALHKDPLRRYGSARELADDLGRFLEGRPVRAQRDSLTYRFSKLVRRNPVATLVSAALVAAVTLGTAATLRQSRVAGLEAERREAVGDFMITVFEGANPDRTPGESVTALELLEAGLARVDGLDAGPAVRVDLFVLMGTLFGQLGHYERAEPVLRQAVAEAESTLPAEDPAIGNALDALGRHLSLLGGLEEAEGVLRSALAARRRDGSASLEVAATEANLAVALRRRGAYDEAAELYESAIARTQAVPEADSTSFSSELMGLGQVRQFQGRLDEAEALFRVVIGLTERAGEEGTRLAYATHNLGVVVAEQERYPEAERIHREAMAHWLRIFPEGHPETARSLEAIGRVVERLGRWAEADSLYREAIAGWSALYGSEHTQIAAIRANQANLRYFAGDFEAAAAAYRDGVRVWRTNDEPRLLAAALRNLGIIEREAGDYASSDTLLAESLGIRQALNGNEHISVAEVHSAFAGLHNRRLRYAEAESSAREAISVYREQLDPGHRLTLHASMELGAALAAQARHDEARTVLEEVSEGFDRILNDTDAQRGRAALWLGITLAALGEPDRARALIEGALPLLDAGLGTDAPESRRARSELARLGG